MISSGTLGTFGTSNTGSLFGTQNKPAFGTSFAMGTGTGTGLFGNTTGTGLFGTSTSAFGNTGLTLGQTTSLGGAFGQTSKIVY